MDSFSKRMASSAYRRIYCEVGSRKLPWYRVTYKLGCTPEEFGARIKRMWLPGMTEENYGIRWCLDHDPPLAVFDFENPEQFAAACHYSNVVPMWVTHNSKKRDYLDAGDLSFVDPLPEFKKNRLDIVFKKEGKRMKDFSRGERNDLFYKAWRAWPGRLRAADSQWKANGFFHSFVTNESWLKVFEDAFNEETPATVFSVFVQKLAKKFDKPIRANVNPGDCDEGVSVAKAESIAEAKAEAKEKTTSQAFFAPTKSLTRAQEVFQEIRAAWPVNKDHGEPYEVSQRAFEAACKERDIEELREACLGYCEAWHSGEITYRTPFWLKSFLSKNGMVDEFLGKQKNKPNPDALKTFEAMWAWYPTFNNKDKENVKGDSFEYWRRMVKPEEYFDFMVAIRAYREERRDVINEADGEDVTQFTKGFIRFVKEWRDQQKYLAISTANALCKEVLWACKEYHLDIGELWKNEMNQHVQGIQKFSKLNAERTAFEVLSKLTLLDLTNTYDPVFLLGISKEILKRAWNRALQLPKKGVPLDSL